MWRIRSSKEHFLENVVSPIYAGYPVPLYGVTSILIFTQPLTNGSSKLTWIPKSKNTSLCTRRPHKLQANYCNFDPTVTWPQIQKRKPRLTLSSVMTSSAMELQLGLFRYLLITHRNKRKQNAPMIFAQMHVLVSCVISFSCVFIFTLRLQQMQVTYAPDASHLFWLQ